MNAKDFIDATIRDRGRIDTVYWVACGGSLIDLIPAHFLLEREGSSVSSSFHTAGEFNILTPRKLGEHSLVVLCSHSGNTPEVAEAAQLAKQAGAAIIALTDRAGSRIDSDQWVTWVYPWGDGVPTREVPSGIALLLAGELLAAQEGYAQLDDLTAGITQLDQLLPSARAKVNAELGDRFAQLCQEHDFLYILGSGPNFSQTYGFAICSLMEMQWQNCAYVHSGEYFHGPFECTEPGVFYFLQLGSGTCRSMDERALRFLQEHTDTLMVLDAREYGMDAVPESVRDYLDPVLFYAMNVELRAARGRVFDHHPDTRRYMGVLEY